MITIIFGTYAIFGLSTYLFCLYVEYKDKKMNSDEELDFSPSIRQHIIRFFVTIFIWPIVLPFIIDYCKDFNIKLW